MINGQEREYLKGSRSPINVCETDMISIEDVLSEQIWIKQPLNVVELVDLRTKLKNNVRKNFQTFIDMYALPELRQSYAKR